MHFICIRLLLKYFVIYFNNIFLLLQYKIIRSKYKVSTINLKIQVIISNFISYFLCVPHENDLHYIFIFCYSFTVPYNYVKSYDETH